MFFIHKSISVDEGDKYDGVFTMGGGIIPHYFLYRNLNPGKLIKEKEYTENKIVYI